MKIEQIECVYCGANNVVSTKITGRKGRISIKAVAGESSESISTPQLKINCPLCSKKYVCITGTYVEYLKNHVQFTEESLDDLKRIMPRLKKLDTIFKNSTGISKLDKKMQQMRSKDYDITFKLFSKRAYLHCKKCGEGLLKRKNTVFVVVSVHEV